MVCGEEEVGSPVKRHMRRSSYIWTLSNGEPVNVLALDCPKCKRKRGQPCASTSGEERPPHKHRADKAVATIHNPLAWKFPGLRDKPRTDEEGTGAWATIDQIEHTVSQYFGDEFAQIQATTRILRFLFETIQEGDLNRARELVNALDGGRAKVHVREKTAKQ